MVVTCGAFYPVYRGVSSILSKIGIKDADPYVTGAVTNTVLLALLQ